MGKPAPVEPVQAPRSSAFKRYKLVTFSVTLFLLFVSAVMYTTVHIATRIENNQLQIDVVGRLNDHAHALLDSAQTIYLQNQEYSEQSVDNNDVALFYLNDIVAEQKQLKNQQQSFENLFSVFQQGGKHTTASTTQIVRPVELDSVQAAKQQMEKTWQAYQPLIHDMADSALITHDPQRFGQIAHSFAGKNPNDLYQPLESIIQALHTDIQQQITLLRWVQTIGIVASLCYFLFFVYFLMRRLTRADDVADAARRETEEIMQTVHNGLFLLNQDLSIGSQYSKELERLLGKKQLGGKNLLDVLEDIIEHPEDLEVAASFVRQLYNPRTKERLIASLNPLIRTPLRIPHETGEETRYLNFTFHRVYHDKDIARVLVNVSDVTHAVLLEEKVQQERGYNDWHVEIISSILKVDPLMMADFIVYTQQRNRKINEKLKEPVQVQADFFDKLQYISREVHGLKGDASSLNLQSFVLLAENLEITLKSLKDKNRLTGEDFLPLTVSLEELFSLTQTIDDLNRRISGKGSSAPTVTQQEPIKKQMTKFVAELAERNGKLVDLGCVGMDNPALNMGLKSNLREMAVQLLRNAVVHGIETPAVRAERNKLNTGHVRVEMQEDGDLIRLTVQDDGNGINFDHIRQTLVDKGVCTPESVTKLDANTLIQYIFVHGFSTQSKSNEDAGRGVGMDVVHERVKQMGGKLAVATRAGAYTSITVTVPRKF